MEEWKTYKLSNIANLSTGFPFDGHKYSSIGTRVLRGENIGDKCFNWDERRDKRWNEEFERIDEFSLRPGDIVLQMDGNVGRNKARISNDDCPMLIAQRVACLRAKENISQAFLYYIVIGKSFKDYLDSVKTGTSIQHISLKQIGDFEVTIPSSYSEQQRIADVLQALDDKIELNTRINHNLEEQAQALYKSWFVDFEPFKDGKFVESELGMIPEGWRVGILGELNSFKRGKNLLSKDAAHGEIPVVAGGMEPSCYHNIANTHAPVITISASGANAGYMRLNHTDVWASDCSYIDSSSQNVLFTYCFLRANERLLRHAQTGAVQPHVKPSDVNNFKAIIAPQYIIDDFQINISSMFKEIKNRLAENSLLAKEREILLPKLMSGEIDY